jgi:YggT family protein
MLIMLVDYGIEALMLLILVSSVLSWVRPDPRNPLVRLLNAVVEPILLPIRSLVPPAGPLDLSPLVAMLILWFLQHILHRALSGGL